MNTSALRARIPLVPVTRATVLRSLLLLGCVGSVGLAAALGAADTAFDPDLARLLRGIAVIKGLMVSAAVGVLWWRFGQPVAGRVAAVYIVGAWLAAAASVSIWQLSHIAAAAVGFHLGEIAVLIVAWHDGLAGPARPKTPVE